MQAFERSARKYWTLSYLTESFKPYIAAAPVEVAERICLDAHNQAVRPAFKKQAQALRLRSIGTFKQHCDF